LQAFRQLKIDTARLARPAPKDRSDSEAGSPRLAETTLADEVIDEAAASSSPIAQVLLSGAGKEKRRGKGGWRYIMVDSLSRQLLE